MKELIKEYNYFTSLSGSEKLSFFLDFEEKLLKSNENEILQYHYNLIYNETDKKYYYYLRSAFMERPLDKVENFLLNKYSEETNTLAKGDIIQILGTLKSQKVLPFVKSNIQSEVRDIRYRCIIVTGWIGEELSLLNERLNNEPDDELRGYAATAMRQMWLEKKVSTQEVLPYLYSAVVKEESEETLSMIIIVVQDLLKRKFGLQELINNRTIKGDVSKAKEKVLKYIQKNQ